MQPCCVVDHRLVFAAALFPFFGLAIFEGTLLHTRPSTITMAHDRINEREERSQASDDEIRKELWKLLPFSSVLAMDLWVTLFLFFLCLQPSWIRHAMDESTKTDHDHFTFYGTLMDLATVSALRLLAAFLAMLVAYYRPDLMGQSSETNLSNLHPNGDKKSQEDLDEEALEEPFYPWFVRFLKRPSFPCELLGILTQILCVAKCLVRMEVELDEFHSKHSMHPLFWIVILVAAIVSMVEVLHLGIICERVGKYGKDRARGMADAATSVESSELSTPLLGSPTEENRSNQDPIELQNADTEAGDNENVVDSATLDTEARGVSDIGADATYKATWRDLVQSCAPDLPLILCAFVFLALAAIAEVCIPRFLGNVLDALSETFAGDDDDATNKHDIAMWDVPGFMENIKLLLVASILAGVFSGIRAAVFTIAGGRVNIRLRIQLMDALLSQEIGFFDVTKTGDITSRLSSDTALAGGQAMRSVDVLFKIASSIAWVC